MGCTPCVVCLLQADIVRELASAFHVREDLRNIISGALVKLCKQSRSVALAALNPDAAPHLNLSQLNLHGRKGQQGLEAAAAAAVSAETLEALRALGLVSAAAAAVPRPEGPADDDEGLAGQDGQGLEDGSDDEFEEYGASEGGSSGSRQQRRRLQQQQQEDEGPDGASHAPAGFTATVALSQLQALRQFSGQWMTMLCRVYIDVSDCVAWTTPISMHAWVAVLTQAPPYGTPLWASSQSRLASLHTSHPVHPLQTLTP